MSKTKITGGFSELFGKEYYKIENVHLMKPFFINLSTNSDIWMFLSSSGSLTAGRCDSNNAIFPYETDDRIHLSTCTGPKTLIRLEGADNKLWEVFSGGYVSPYSFARNLYKSLDGGAVAFEEINFTLGLTFLYRWETSEKHGIVRSCVLTNNGKTAVSGKLIDGVANIIPYGVPQMLGATSSCLTDAYKTCEFDGRVAVYSMTTKINDSPDPIEILRANTAWSTGESEATLLTDEVLDAFARGENPVTQERVNGRKSAYLTLRSFSLEQGESMQWKTVLDAGLSQPDIAALRVSLAGKPDTELERGLDSEIADGATELRRIAGVADGLQCTGDKISSAHHYMNVLYNNMRGGAFLNSYGFDAEELDRFAAACDAGLMERKRDFFDAARAAKDILELKELAFKTSDPQIIRLVLEFLPLSFSRRHGDPSRPWNKFFIKVKDADGKYIYHYEGNWRDIFQNWEALCLSFPGYLENVIAKFLNASTADGYNPYRISNNGIDWEVPEPDNDFSGFGYWGDHQIVYLTRLLEALRAHDPSGLKRLMKHEIFTYANVPYELADYDSMLKDGKNTIEFRYDKHNAINEAVKKHCSDGKLLFARGSDKVYLVSFWEKLLVPVLAKLSYLVVGGGIWMNTQRPEWNDANNAIVGIGLSMVTTYQLYRHVSLLRELAEIDGSVPVSGDVKTWLKSLSAVYGKYLDKLDSCDSVLRKSILDDEARTADSYRLTLYKKGLGDKANLSFTEISDFLSLAQKYLAYTIDANELGGIYHSYNLIKFNGDGLEVAPLFPMLEGQTAVLGSGKLDGEKTLGLLERMTDGSLYSKEHGTFYLYPVKHLKSFMGKNIIPQDRAKNIKLLGELLEAGGMGIVVKDKEGNIRFHDSICQAQDLCLLLDGLGENPEWTNRISSGKKEMLEVFDETFRHSEFTGRSGIMYKYEGIGCIYWHQNSKFLLSVQEVFAAACRERNEASKLKDAYYRTREGLGFNKQPDLWGAFPLEPYSHSPYLMPAQQPGMTGQVKEDIITRRLELGLEVKDGIISFGTGLLRKKEFLNDPMAFEYFGTGGDSKSFPLDKGMLGYTLCQTPVIYKLADKNRIEVAMSDGTVKTFDGLTLDPDSSVSVFDRNGAIQKICVSFVENEIMD